MAGYELKELPWLPSLSSDSLMLLGFHPAVAPMQVSRRKTSATPLVSPATRLLAEDSKATKRPSALMAAPTLLKLPCVPSPATDTRTVLGVQPAGAPEQVSRRKTSATSLVSPATKVVASE